MAIFNLTASSLAQILQSAMIWDETRTAAP